MTRTAGRPARDAEDQAMKRHLIGATILSGVMLLPTVGVAAHDGPHPDEGAAARTAQSDASGGSADASAAADLRTTLDLLLGEHLILAAKATGAALAGDTDAFEAYGGLLNTNGTDLGAMIGAVYGQEAQDAFNTSWSAHNGFFVDYTTGVARDDRRMARRAVRNLTRTYVPQFSELIAGATGLPLDAVTQLIGDHVMHTKAIVDAQAARDWEEAYAAIRTAYAHMQMIGDALASAIAGQSPELFPGDPASAAADLRIGLDQLLQEHLYLASFATGAALDGRSDEFAAAGSALNTNGTDLGSAIGSLFGQEAQDAFNTSWSAHNGFFVDYTTGVAEGDQAKMDQAVEDLTTVYVPEFAALLAGATGLPQEALEELLTHHVVATKAVVDAQGAEDAAGAATADVEAARHMQEIGDPLAAAIVAAMPEAFA